MTYKVWACFYNDGEIKHICLHKKDCVSIDPPDCGEFVAKLIPIERDLETTKVEELTKSLKQSTRKLKQEAGELEKSIRKFKIK